MNTDRCTTVKDKGKKNGDRERQREILQKKKKKKESDERGLLKQAET